MEQDGAYLHCSTRTRVPRPTWAFCTAGALKKVTRPSMCFSALSSMGGIFSAFLTREKTPRQRQEACIYVQLPDCEKKKSCKRRGQACKTGAYLPKGQERNHGVFTHICFLCFTMAFWGKGDRVSLAAYLPLPSNQRDGGEGGDGMTASSQEQQDTGHSRGIRESCVGFGLWRTWIFCSCRLTFFWGEGRGHSVIRPEDKFQGPGMWLAQCFSFHCVLGLPTNIDSMTLRSRYEKCCCCCCCMGLPNLSQKC